MDQIRQCFAYNIKGERCDHPAGHPGEHAITYSWTDDECYEPGRAEGIPMTKSREEAAIKFMEEHRPVLPEPMPEPVGCIACQHKHKGGACKCGCYEFIG